MIIELIKTDTRDVKIKKKEVHNTKRVLVVKHRLLDIMNVVHHWLLMYHPECSDVKIVVLNYNKKDNKTVRTITVTSLNYRD